MRRQRKKRNYALDNLFVHKISVLVFIQGFLLFIFRKQQQQWCSVCAFPAYEGCHETQHPIQNSMQFYNARMLLLKSIINKTNYLCNEALVDCHKIESAHQVILAWIKWLQLEIVQSAAKNTATIAQLESLITDEAWAHIPQEANMYATINNINQLIAK